MSLFRLFILALLGCFCPPLHAADNVAAIDSILVRGQAAVAAYDEAAPLAAASELSALYFEHFEALELELGILDPALKKDMEVLFGALNGSAMRGAPRAQLEEVWQKLAFKLNEARSRFGDSGLEAGTFFKALLILLREGAEAMLVVAALATWLRRAGAADKTWVIHAGLIVAVLMSIVTGLVINHLLKDTGAPRAVMEGVTMVMASIMLFCVSCWLFAKRSAKKWEEWIAGQMENALGKGSLLALGGTSFLAVYREGAETVLFYEALASSAPGQGAIILAGFGVAVLLLVAFYFALQQASLRLPFGLFFGSTSLLLYVLSIIFLGQGMVELQAAGWIASIYLPGIPQIDWLGIAPSVQSLGAQALLLLFPCVWFVWQRTLLASR